MAAQIKPHTVDQIRGLRTNKSKCPCCGEPAFIVRESRKIPEGVRRRHSCEKCFHRETRFEITSSAYNELKELRIAVKHIKSYIEAVNAYVVPEDVEIPCTSCSHKTKYGCSFEYPEADSVDAIGCTQYEKA